MQIPDRDTMVRPGDTVALRSGGPPMLIERTDGGIAWCTWAGGWGCFPLPCLRMLGPLASTRPALDLFAREPAAA